ncbi:hypothetical protein AYO20_08839 [Fonsecaea nubica]|uniref:N-acetyltransferase domain-containing protein n=1 Tax=Fonsecaea nubica TaxID=856822 RepID=A0A178CMN9_9EURO|nr:hypothetical protein AYO20_08839 [Fonsecaea nubica]OAL30265.1 hypothetical protein AYO20_08839 [Fonsecaea nubica]
MRINEHTCVSTTKVVLVPYSAHHVPKYHGWMKDPEIQEATASEPLTLEEEYAMQRSWRDDGDKLTFIVCQPHSCADADGVECHESSDGETQREIDAMVGDVNLFISTAPAQDDSAQGEGEGGGEILVAGELELMIAETAQQRKGYGRATLLAFLKYITQHEREILAEFQDYSHHGPAPGSPTTTTTIPRQQAHFMHLSVKIGGTNLRSIALFESLAFRKTGENPNYFGEYELRLSRAELGDLIARVEGDHDAVAAADTAERKGFLVGYREARYSCH